MTILTEVNDIEQRIQQANSRAELNVLVYIVKGTRIPKPMLDNLVIDFVKKEKELVR